MVKNDFLYTDKDDYKNYLYSGIVGKIEKIFINFMFLPIEICITYRNGTTGDETVEL